MSNRQLLMIPFDPDAEAIFRRFRRRASAWPEEVAGSLEHSDSANALRDRFRGTLLWGAVGDAVGRATEGRSWEAIHARYGPEGIQDYCPWRGWTGGPKGTITDDTQLTMVIAESLIAARGDFDPDDFSRRLVEWLHMGRGKGKATTIAVQALADGVAWHRSGARENSAGNGAAMRAAPIGLVAARDPSPERIAPLAILYSWPTHTHPWRSRRPPRSRPRWPTSSGRPPSDARSTRSVCSGSSSTPSLPSTSSQPCPNRALPTQSSWPTACWRSPDWLATEPKVAFEYFYTGAFVLQSLPSAFYCFLRSPGDPRQVILTGANCGHDTDTVASMVGNLVARAGSTTEGRSWEAVRAVRGPMTAWPCGPNLRGGGSWSPGRGRGVLRPRPTGPVDGSIRDPDSDALLTSRRRRRG